MHVDLVLGSGACFVQFHVLLVTDSMMQAFCTLSRVRPGQKEVFNGHGRVLQSAVPEPRILGERRTAHDEKHIIAISAFPGRLAVRCAWHNFDECAMSKVKLVPPLEVKFGDVEPPLPGAAKDPFLLL